MDLTQTLALLDRHQRIELRERGSRREVTLEAVSQVHQGDGAGMVVYSQLTEGNADRVIEEQIAAFQAHGQDFEWKLYGHDTPANLKERLLAHDFTPETSESVMVLDLQEAPAALLQPVNCDIRRVTDPSQIAEIGKIHECVWRGTDPAELSARTHQYLEDLTDNLIHDSGHESLYIAYSGDIPVSYARITFQDSDPFAGLWGGSTL